MNIFYIPANSSFFDMLVTGIISRFEDLATLRILLPSRRSCKQLREAFLRYSAGKPMILPSMHAIGDFDPESLTLESLASGSDAPGNLIPQALPKLEQLILLTRLIAEKQANINIEHAAQTATQLASLLQELQLQQIDLSCLQEIISDDMAEHWQQIASFLGIISDVWPALLASRQAVDQITYRNMLIRRQAELWQTAEPDHPVIIAGSTGTILATAELIRTISALKQGYVVLPALDNEMDQASWDKIDPFHPQYNLKNLLEYLAVSRNNLTTWSHSPPTYSNQARMKLVSEIMRPAATSYLWAQLQMPSHDALDGLSYAICQNMQQEAQIIALIMRSCLETPHKTAALVTNDRTLARRVKAILYKWHIDIDDSAGQNLVDTMPAAFMRLIAEMASSDAAPIPLLACLKHPLSSIAPEQVSQLELAVMRGVRISTGFDGLINSLKLGEKEELVSLIISIKKAGTKFLRLIKQPKASFTELLTSHIEFAENMSTSQKLWHSQEGSSLSEFLAQLLEYSPLLGNIHTTSYGALLHNLFVGQTFRPSNIKHPRLVILSPTEARFYHQDLIIASGLNEGSWPENIKTGPWISAKMRQELGLAPLERAIGHAAFDLYHLLCAKEVVLTRAQKIDGTMTVPSRWLLRLETVLTKLGQYEQILHHDWQYWAESLSRAKQVKPILEPQAKPGSEHRFKQLSVTDIEKLMRDPYSLYARKILRLRPLGKIDADPGAAEFGTIMHFALEICSPYINASMTKEALYQQLLACGQQAFSSLIDRPTVLHLWYPRFERIARWLSEWEHPSGQIVAEHPGQLKFNTKYGIFTLSAKADRLEISEHGMTILDYKTGTLPENSQIKLGVASQMILEALIAQEGGFACQLGQKMNIHQLIYLRITGAEIAGQEKILDLDIEQLTKEASIGLYNLINSFLNPDTPFLATPIPAREPQYNDYLHLARTKEWS